MVLVVLLVTFFCLDGLAYHSAAPFMLHRPLLSSFRSDWLGLTRQGAAASSVNQISYIEINKALMAAKREHKRVLQLLLRFWQYLLMEMVDLGIMDHRAFLFPLPGIFLL